MEDVQSSLVHSFKKKKRETKRGSEERHGRSRKERGEGGKKEKKGGKEGRGKGKEEQTNNQTQVLGDLNLESKHVNLFCCFALFFSRMLSCFPRLLLFQDNAS